MADSAKNQMRPIARNLKPPPQPRFAKNHHDSPNLATFKTNVLALQTVKKVRISHYENGPFMFCAQLESSDNDFQRLVSKLQKTQLTRLQSPPTAIGMACVALHERKFYRAAIAKVPQHHTHDNISVNFVDYGYSKSVKLENLFYIPDEFLNPFIFTMSFCLAGCKAKNFKVPEQDLGFYFRQLTENRSLTLKCVPCDGIPILQYCELYIDENTNILDKLKSWDPYKLKFSTLKPLEMKVTHEVKVSYVDSAQEFYVHIQKPEVLNEYDLTCDELFKVMSRSPPVYRNPKPGTCCAVNLGGEYHRGLVVGALQNHTVQVKIVDFGIVEEIPEKHVHLLTEKFVEKPPQAHRACLKGFEGLEVSDNISTQFDIFCGDGRGERKVFNMVILDIFNGSYLVELDDPTVNPPLNVNKMLLKNSRPLIETIQLENAKKRQKDARKDGTAAEPQPDNAQQAPTRNYEREKNSSQRGRGSQVNRGPQRNSPNATNPPPDASKRQQSPRTHFGKTGRGEESSLVGGTYYKSQKEANVWGSKESTPSEAQSNKSSDWEQPKNITREQNSNASWNDLNEKKQKGARLGKQKNINEPTKKTASDLKSGWVSTMLSVNRAVVHFDEHIEGLERILDEMFAFYENKNSRPHLKEIKPGVECAVRSNDGNWYRSKVDSVNSDKIKVIHREYGNSEIVHKTKIRALDEKFSKMHDLAVSTYFAVKPSIESEQKTLFNEMVKQFQDGAKEFNFKVVQKFRDGWILEPIDQQTNKNVIDELVKSKKAQKLNENELEKFMESKAIVEPIKKERKSPEKIKKIEKIERSEKILIEKVEVPAEEPAEVPVEPPAQLALVEEKSDKVTIKMTALTSPNDFYISLGDSSALFRQLQADIQIIASGAATLEDFTEGSLCLAKTPYDSLWYRAKIIDSDEQNVMVTVRCMDDGKTFSVDDKTLLKIMPAALEQKKFFGVLCSLPVKIERKFEEEATELMINMMERELNAEFMDEIRDGGKNYVEIFDGNENVVDVLVEKSFATRLEMIQPGKGYTSHINSLSSFYLQFEKDQLKLDLISQYFEEANGKFKKIEAEEGDIVAALFPEDECWYRSRVEDVSSSGFTVSFIDYGNSCLVKEIGQIAEVTVRDLPAMSKHCCLALPKTVKSFSDEAEKKFVEICASGATILDIKGAPVKAGNEATEIEIFSEGRNIIDDLISLCEASTGSHDRMSESNES